MADMAASVLAKLKNKAKSSGISYQQCLQLFFQEEFLRRLAGSKYAENFVRKGGLFIYTLTNFESRATVDVDFLMRGLNNDLARMDEIIAEILAVNTGNDFVTFKADKTEPIAVQRKYHGVSTQITQFRLKSLRPSKTASDRCKPWQNNEKSKSSHGEKRRIFARLNDLKIVEKM